MPEERARRQFTEMVEQAGAPLDLGRACLLIASQEYPEADVETYLARLSFMGGELRERLRGVPSHESPLVMNEYLFVEQGFRGNQDEYYDPRNSFLSQVLDRRVGIPITLSTLCIE